MIAPSFSQKRLRSLAASLVGAAMIIVGGCGAPVEPPAEAARKSVPGPQGSFALALPDGLGYVEPLVERIGGSGKTGLGGKQVLAAYFVGPDGKEPMANLPSSVEASLILQGASPVNVTLRPSPLGKSSWSRVRFATDPGDYSQDEIRGELTANIDGKRVTVPIALR